MSAKDSAYKGFNELEALATNESPATADLIPIFDTSFNKPKTVLASRFAYENTSDINQYLVRHLQVTATLAEINAGTTLLAGVTGKTIRVVGFAARVSGTFTTTTSIDLEDTNGTPVAIQTILVAAAADAAVLKDGTSNVTRGLGMWGDLTASAGIAVTNTGSAAAGGTSITFDLDYIVK